MTRTSPGAERPSVAADDGTLRALSAVCPHRGGPLADGTIDREVVMCPLHQHAFDLKTGCSTTGAEPLRAYSVQQDVDQNIILQSTHQGGNSSA